MEFRDLKAQYSALNPGMDEAILAAVREARYISGPQTGQLEAALAEFTGSKHCITCANGTDALVLALRALGIGSGDAVFVPDFTFFATAEAVVLVGATPVFVDVFYDTFNIDPGDLERAIDETISGGKLVPKAVIPVDLFGLPADYDAIMPIAARFGLRIIEDGAQGFGGAVRGKRVCSFGDIATTSFFPAKPLGCYGDGGAVFTGDDGLASLIRSMAVHGKGADKYDNVRVGTNSRLDTIQAAVLLQKLRIFENELELVNRAAERYSERLRDLVNIPEIPAGYASGWAQYTIVLDHSETRAGLAERLKSKGIPTMIYYAKPLRQQGAFTGLEHRRDCPVTDDLCGRVLSLPIHPYLTPEQIDLICGEIKQFFAERK